MGNSLRDQLLKKGLTTKKQTKAAERETREKATDERKKRKQGEAVEAVDAAAVAAAKAREEKVARDRALNQQREAEREARERAAQVRDLILSHHLKHTEGSVTRNFPDGKRVRSIQVTEEIHRKIANGALGIVSLEGKYYVVPGRVA
ncbi:MAG: DUF2058 family protein, partial [Nitrospiraceae bacterium]|nr:DUF2058 family protein [Nitrospiraceae bacterium]